MLVVDALDRLLGEAGLDPAGPGDLCVPELVGREEEVARIRAFLDSPRRVLLLPGVEGAGRERVLAVESDAQARTRGISSRISGWRWSRRTCFDVA